MAASPDSFNKGEQDNAGDRTRTLAPRTFLDFRITNLGAKKYVRTSSVAWLFQSRFR